MLKILGLQVGVHNVRLTCADFATRDEQVQIDPAKVTYLEAKLVRQ